MADVVSIKTGAEPEPLTQDQSDAIERLQSAIRGVRMGEIVGVLLVMECSERHPQGAGWTTAWLTSTANTVLTVGALELLKRDIFVNADPRKTVASDG